MNGFKKFDVRNYTGVNRDYIIDTISSKRGEAEMPTVQDLSDHWSLSSRTIWKYARQGLKHHRVNREFRFEWPDIWSFEDGPRPPTALHERYTTPLATKRTLATALKRSVRSIDRFIERGLPTRNVGGNVRFQIHDAAAWLERHAGVDSHVLTRKLLALHGRPQT